MKRFFLLLFLFLTLFLLSCRREPLRYLVVTNVTHFEIRGNGSSLNLPVFAGTLSVDQIVRDVTLAEYYHKKLAEVYKFQSFTMQEGATSETLIEREGDLKQPQKVLRYEDSTAAMDLLMTSFDHGVAHYMFRISDPAGKQVRDHSVEVPSGKSASIGTMFDKKRGVGQLVVVSMRSLAVSRQTTPEDLASFLREKNSVPGDTSAVKFVADDQKWMDELFGAGKMELPIPKPSDQDSFPEWRFIEFDTAPSLQGNLDVKYPATAKDDSVEGQVLVQLYVSKAGEVKKCRVIKSVRADLDSAALSALQQARFTPAASRGVAVGVYVAIPISFKLNK